jgi:flagellar motor switch protein FliN
LSRETNVLDPNSHEAAKVAVPRTPVSDSGLFDWLPKMERRQVRLEHLLTRLVPESKLPPALNWLEQGIGAAITLDRPEVLWRASGLNRPGLVVQLTATRLGTRLALGIENPIAHAVVDRLLGFDRSFGESRLQLTPVEWGVWSFLVLRALDSLEAVSAADRRDRPVDPQLLGPGDLTLDRVGPDLFDPKDLGSIVTIRWSLRLEKITAAARLWLPESIIRPWLARSASPAMVWQESGENPSGPERLTRTNLRIPPGELSSAWCAIAGLVSMPLGLRPLKAGSVLPFTEARLVGTARSPSGPVDLVLDLDDQDVRFRIETRPVAESGGRLVRVEAGPVQERRPRDPLTTTNTTRSAMSQPTASQKSTTPAPGVAALDVPVTLTVELGRVNMTLTQLADIKPGDIVELGRNSRAPVELTSNGRLVARGELVLIDTELGVRVTNTFL